MFVQEAGHLLSECTCLQKLSRGTGIVEKLSLQLRRKRVPLHYNGRTEAPKNVPFLLGQNEGARSILFYEPSYPNCSPSNLRYRQAR